MKMSIGERISKEVRMKERIYVVKIAGQYVVLTELEYEKSLIYGIVK